MENHILVGLGGTGGKVLKAFKMRMFEEYPDSNVRGKLPIGLLYVDSTREMMGVGMPDFRVLGQDASFTENEFVHIRDVDIEQILDNINSYPQLKGMVNNTNTVKAAIGALGHAAGQKRRAGRVLFAANATKYKNALNNVYAKVNDISRTDKLVIHIFTGLAGGTGSGSIIDAIVQSRKAFPGAKILVYAMVPEVKLPKAGIDTGRYYQNGYAALNEINSLQSGVFTPCDVTDAGRDANLFSLKIKGVADGVMLYSNVNENGVTVNSFEEMPQLVSNYVYFRVFMDARPENEDFIRAANFENMDDFCLEYSEKSKGKGEKEIARTKKLNSFGIKRVIYPENRILKHVVYSVGQRLLYQFQFNNWRDNIGFVGEFANKDYKELYLNDGNKSRWMLDDTHLTLEKGILPTDQKYDTFQDYWHDKAIGYADDAKSADCPLNELDNIMSDFFARSFRNKGVEKYYEDKAEVIADLAREIRQNIERELFTSWKDGVIALYDLLKISEAVLAFVANRLKGIDADITKNEEELEALNTERSLSVSDWKDLNVLQRMVGRGARLYAEHQEILTDFYVSKTKSYALQFAKALISRLNVEIGALSTEIGAFYAKIAKAIEEVDKQITLNSKQSEGLEDMSGAVIEVGEEGKMLGFERELITNKTEQPNMARELRKAIIPDEDFIPFGVLEHQISIDKIRDAFDLRLSTIIKEKHELLAANSKLFGMNILHQLQQELPTEEDIRRFAKTIVDQSGVYLKFDSTEMTRYVPNNENPSINPSSINRKCLLISIPKPEGNESLKLFADKLAQAFKDSFNNAAQSTTLNVDMKSPHQDEISIVSVVYCFPMRTIVCLKDYKSRYESLLNSPDEKSAREYSILLHSEGDGKDLSDIFIADQMKSEEYWPYMFIAAAMGQIEKTEEGWGYSTTDEYNIKTEVTISDTFDGLLNSDEMTEELRESIYNDVSERLADPDITKADRKSLEEAIIMLVKTEIVPVCNPTTTKAFAAIANTARDIVNNKK